MELLLIAVVSGAASALTLFSGFGLGTILLPVFALFLPTPVAVAATAIVHAANNLLKGLLLWRLADFKIVFRFGLPAITASFLGALLLSRLSGLPQIAAYQLMGLTGKITPINLVMGILILGFSLFELLPTLQKVSFDKRFLPVGGLLSGFFGGLSGHQGAFRAAFLAKIDITPQGFVGTNAVIALLVDGIRIGVYVTILGGMNWESFSSGPQGRFILVGIVSAFSGVILGRRFLPHITMKTVHAITGSLLMLIGLVLAGGFI